MDEVRDAEQGMSVRWRIGRESLELAYSWETDGDEKTEEFGIRDKEE